MEELKAMMKVMMNKMEENMKEIKQERREIKTEMDKKEEVWLNEQKMLVERIETLEWKAAQRQKGVPKNKVRRLGTWNIRSIKEKEEELVEEMEKQNIEILGITETKKKGRGMRSIHKGYWMIWSGIEDTGRAKGGVGLVVAPNRITKIINEKSTNERLLKVDMKQDVEETWTIIVAYGVNDDAQKEEKDKFFEDLQK
ncbi:hypothetical protein CBL_10648 [Carabus blaptoides fortunei]